MINIQEFSAIGITEIDASYVTDKVILLLSPNQNIILKEYLTEDDSSYYASTSNTGTTLQIKRGKRPSVSYVSYIEIYVPSSFTGSVKLTTTSGKIEVSNYNGAVTCYTNSGKIAVVNSNISGTLNSNTGGVELEVNGLLGNMEATSGSGRVTAIISQSSSFNINATSNTGKVVNDFSDTFTTTDKSITGTWGTNSSNTITLTSNSGTIEINKK